MAACGPPVPRARSPPGAARAGRHAARRVDIPPPSFRPLLCPDRLHRPRGLRDPGWTGPGLRLPRRGDHRHRLAVGLAPRVRGGRGGGPQRTPRPGRRAGVAEGDVRGPGADRRVRHPPQLRNRGRLGRRDGHGERGPRGERRTRSQRGARRRHDRVRGSLRGARRRRGGRRREHHRVETALSAPADAPFTLALDNRDSGVPDDVVIKDAGGAEAFKTSWSQARRLWSTMCPPFPPGSTASSARCIPT